MTESEFNQNLGKVSALLGTEGEEFVSIINEMMGLLDEGDFEDFFGTSGWRDNLGWA